MFQKGVGWGEGTCFMFWRGVVLLVVFLSPMTQITQVYLKL